MPVQDGGRKMVVRGEGEVGSVLSWESITDIDV